MWFTWMLLALMVAFIYYEIEAQKLREHIEWVRNLRADPIAPFSFERAAANMREYAASMQKVQQAAVTATSHLRELQRKTQVALDGPDLVEQQYSAPSITPVVSGDSQ